MRILIIFILYSLGFSKNIIHISSDERLPFVGDYQDKGYVVELIEQALNSSEDTVHFYSHPWNRTLHEVGKGVVDIVPFLSKELEDEFLFSRFPVGQVNVSFFLAKTSQWEYGDESSLKKILIGAVYGYSYEKKIDAYLNNSSTGVDQVDFSFGEEPLTVLIKKLFSKRLDAVLSDRVIFTRKVLEMGFDPNEFKEIVIENASKEFYVGFSKKCPRAMEYKNRFDHEISKMKESGFYNQTLEKYQ